MHFYMKVLGKPGPSGDTNYIFYTYLKHHSVTKKYLYSIRKVCEVLSTLSKELPFTGQLIDKFLVCQQILKSYLRLNILAEFSLFLKHLKELLEVL